MKFGAERVFTRRVTNLCAVVYHTDDFQAWHVKALYAFTDCSVWSV